MSRGGGRASRWVLAWFGLASAAWFGLALWSASLMDDERDALIPGAAYRLFSSPARRNPSGQLLHVFVEDGSFVLQPQPPVEDTEYRLPDGVAIEFYKTEGWGVWSVVWSKTTHDLVVHVLDEEVSKEMIGEIDRRARDMLGLPADAQVSRQVGERWWMNLLGLVCAVAMGVPAWEVFRQGGRLARREALSARCQ